MAQLYAVSGISIFIFMVLLFLIAQLKKDNSIIDIGWGMGFVIVAVVTFFYHNGYDSRQLLILILVTIWGVRLSTHLLIRSIGRAEDFRYANFRENWGKNVVLIAFFRVFMLQALTSDTQVMWLTNNIRSKRTDLFPGFLASRT